MQRKQDPAAADTSPAPSSRWPAPTKASAVVAAALLLVGSAAGYVASHATSGQHEDVVACLSAPGAISCGPVDSPGDAEYAVPLDVAWTQDGAFHESGRPVCLPPTGRGTVTVKVTWAEVDVAGVTYKQVLGVYC